MCFKSELLFKGGGGGEQFYYFCHSNQVPLELFKGVIMGVNRMSRLTHNPDTSFQKPCWVNNQPRDLHAHQLPANCPSNHNRSISEVQQHKRCSGSTVLCIVIHSNANTTNGHQKKYAHSTDGVGT